jgi:hypothetical protein
MYWVKELYIITIYLFILLLLLLSIFLETILYKLNAAILLLNSIEFNCVPSILPRIRNKK